MLERFSPTEIAKMTWLLPTSANSSASHPAGASSPRRWRTHPSSQGCRDAPHALHQSCFVELLPVRAGRCTHGTRLHSRVCKVAAWLCSSPEVAPTRQERPPHTEGGGVHRALGKMRLPLLNAPSERLSASDSLPCFLRSLKHAFLSSTLPRLLRSRLLTLPSRLVHIFLHSRPCRQVLAWSV